MGFDKYFESRFKDLHEAVCCGDLVAVNYKRAIKKGFKEGQQSKQAEIDEMKSKIQELWTELDDRQSKEYIIERCEAIIQEILK